MGEDKAKYTLCLGRQYVIPRLTVLVAFCRYHVTQTTDEINYSFCDC
jgi:hypothetical protein